MTTTTYMKRPETQERWLRFAGDRHQWYGAFVLLNMMDIFLTLYIVVWHAGKEVNPVGSFLIAQAGWVTFIAFKLFECVLVLLSIDMIYRHRPGAARMLVGTGCSLYFLLMFWNCLILWQI